MLGSSSIIAFAATSKPEEAKRFYGDVLGIRLVADEPYALVFDANGVMLRVQKSEAVNPPQHTVLGWHVEDIAATVDGLAQRGVAFERYPQVRQDERGVWTTPSGAKVAWFKDPDGNTLSLTASAY